MAGILNNILTWAERTARTWRTARELASSERSMVASQKGIGERVFTSAMGFGTSFGWLGGWSQDRWEMVLHYRHWVYLAIDRINKELSSHAPNIAFIHADKHKLNGGHRKAVAINRNRYFKSNHAIHPHEEIEPAGPDHPLSRLIAKPNEWDTFAELITELNLFLELTGNSYLWVIPNRLGTPRELHVIPSHWVWPRMSRHKPNGIEYYEIRPLMGSGTLRLPPEEVIHLKYKSPLHKIDGHSPQAAGAEWIDTEESINRSRFFSFKNGVFPVGALELDAKFADPDDQAIDRIYAKFFARMQGEHNAGRPMILPPGASYKPLVVSPREMDFPRSVEQCRDQVLSLYGVPKELLGIQPAGNDLSWYAPLFYFTRFVINPKMRTIGSAFTQHLARRWSDNLRMWWDDTTPDNPDQLNKDLETDFRMGTITPNEARAIRGRQPYQHGGNDPLIMVNYSPMPVATGQDLTLSLTPAQAAKFGPTSQQEESLAVEESPEAAQAAQDDSDAGNSQNGDGNQE